MDHAAIFSPFAMMKFLEMKCFLQDDVACGFFFSEVKLEYFTLFWCTDEEYERSWEQNEEFGLNDMDTSSADAAYNTN